MTAGAPLPAALVAAIRSAARRLGPEVVATPLVPAPLLSERLGLEILLKLEILQRSGSFKYRPALNAVLAALERGRPAGFVTSSSGNFGIAAATAARRVGLPLDLVMMPSASGHKAAVARRLGARIVGCADDYAAREERVAELVRERGLTALHPHDGEDTVAGDATVGLEIARAMPGPGSVIVPTSGAGLVAGVIGGLRFAGAAAAVYAVQPAGNGSLARSLAAGRRVRAERVTTIADGLTAAIPGELGFAIARDQLAGAASVGEGSIRTALRMLVEEQRLMVEPASAVPLAALLECGLRPREPVVLVLSGANVAPRDFVRLIGD